MSIEMFIMNIILVIILTFLLSIGLQKVVQEKSIQVTRVFWNFLMPTYVLANIFSVLLIFLGRTDSLELLLMLQKYAMGAHIVASFLFLAAFDGAKTTSKAVR